MFIPPHLAVPGAFLLVSTTVWASDGMIGSFMRLRPARLAGKWSYSFYLWHYPVLRTTYRICSSQLSVAFMARHCTALMVAAVLFTVTTALILASLTYRWVELPGIALGRRLIAGLRSRRAPLPAAE